MSGRETGQLHLRDAAWLGVTCGLLLLSGCAALSTETTTATKMISRQEAQKLAARDAKGAARPKETENPTQHREEMIRRFEQSRDQASYQAAQSRYSQNDLAGCRELLQQILDRNPDHLEARLLMAQANLETDRLDEARRHAEYLVEHFPDDARSHYTMGLLLDTDGKTETALVHYARAAEIEPANEVYRTSHEMAQRAVSGSSAESSGEESAPPEPPLPLEPRRLSSLSDESRDSAESRGPAGESEKSRISGLFDQAHEALAEGDSKAALQRLREAAAIRPNDPQIPVSAAVFLLRRNYSDLAVKLLSEAAGKFPKSAGIQRTMGTAYYRMGDYKSSQRALQQALSLDKSSPLTYFLMGCTLAKLGQADAAEGHFRQARILDPKFTVQR